MSDASETLILRAGSERWADTLVDVSPADVLRVETLPSTCGAVRRAAGAEGNWRGPLALFIVALAIFAWALWNYDRGGAHRPAPPRDESVAARVPVVRPLPVEPEVNLARLDSDPSPQEGGIAASSAAHAGARASAAQALFEGRHREGARLYRALPEGAVDPELLQTLLQLLEASVEP